MRFFNVAGPVRPDEHYAIPPLERVDVEELLGLIRAKQYFVLHAPRQTGKTPALLNRGEAGNFRCVNVNVEVGQVARDDTARTGYTLHSEQPGRQRAASGATTIPMGFGPASWRSPVLTMR